MAIGRDTADSRIGPEVFDALIGGPQPRRGPMALARSYVGYARAGWPTCEATDPFISSMARVEAGPGLVASRGARPGAGLAHGARLGPRTPSSHQPSDEDSW